MSDVPSIRGYGALPCTSCGRCLPRTTDNFHRDSLCVDGLKRRCRDCVNEAERARYTQKAEEVCRRVRERRASRSAYFDVHAGYEAA
jgi:hypothetical protein